MGQRMQVAGWCAIAVGMLIGVVSAMLLISRSAEHRDLGVPLEAAPYLWWSGLAGVAVVCGSVLYVGGLIIDALASEQQPRRGSTVPGRGDLQ